jgi:hypothetical protein
VDIERRNELFNDIRERFPNMFFVQKGREIMHNWRWKCRECWASCTTR